MCVHVCTCTCVYLCECVCPILPHNRALIPIKWPPSISFSSARTLLVTSSNAYSGLSSFLHSTLLGVQANYQSVSTGPVLWLSVVCESCLLRPRVHCGGPVPGFQLLPCQPDLPVQCYLEGQNWGEGGGGGGGGGWHGALRGQYRTDVDLMHKTMNFIMLMLNGIYSIPPVLKSASCTSAGGILLKIMI